MAGSGRHDFQGVCWGCTWASVLSRGFRLPWWEQHPASPAPARQLVPVPSVLGGILVFKSPWRLGWFLQCQDSLSHGLSWLSRCGADGAPSPRALGRGLGLGELPACAWEQSGAGQGGGDVSLQTHWSEEALAEVGASSCPVAEPIQARGSPCWVAEWAALGKSLLGTGCPCLCWVVGSACHLSMPSWCWLS